MANIEFDETVARASVRLKPTALKLTRNKDSANDLIQETLKKAYSNRDKFKRGTNLNAWLQTIMRNTFITEYNRNTRKRAVIDYSGSYYLFDSGRQIVGNQGESMLLLQEIESAIGQLDTSLRTTFNMYVSGYKYHEVADILGIPIGTVKNRIHVARKELKHELRWYRPNPVSSN